MDRFTIWLGHRDPMTLRMIAVLFLAGGIFVIVLLITFAVQAPLFGPVAIPTPSSTPTWPATLTPVTSLLRVNVQPVGAKILVDGVPNGVTPNIIELPPGTHTVRVEKDGYRPLEQIVALRGGGATSIEESLQDIAPPLPTIILTPGPYIQGTPVPVAVQAVDNDKVASVSLSIDQTPRAQATGASLTYTWDTNSAAVGDHKLQASAVDPSGNIGLGEQTVRLDPQPVPTSTETIVPTWTFTPVPTWTFTPWPTWTYVPTFTPTVTFTLTPTPIPTRYAYISSPTSGFKQELPGAVHFVFGGWSYGQLSGLELWGGYLGQTPQLLTTVYASGTSYTATFDWGPSTAGTVQFYAKAYDTSGASGTSLTTYGTIYEVPTSTPTLTPTPPTATATLTPSITWTPTLTVTWTPTSTFTPMPTPVPYAVRVNAGSLTPYTDSQGRLWSADQPYFAGSWGYVDGNIYSNVTSIAGTSDPVLYQTERWGMSAYRFDVPNGTYRVTLKFAEIFWSGSGQRVFDVRIEDSPVLTNFDLIATVGRFYADDYVDVVEVNDERLDIEFSATVDFPKVSAIEVILISVDSGYYEQDHPAVTYSGTWTTALSTNASGGSWAYSSTAGSRAALRFNGSQVTWYTVKGPDQGIARVRIDSGDWVTRDNYASSYSYYNSSPPAAWVFGELLPGVHTIEIEVTGTKNSLSTGSYIYADAFRIEAATPTPTETPTVMLTPTLTNTPAITPTITPTPGLYDDGDAAVVYNGTWATAADPHVYGGAVHYSSTVGAKVTLSFTGSQVTWYTVYGPNQGRARVRIDGGVWDPCNNYAPDFSFYPAAARVYGGLAPGVHTIEVEVLGTSGGGTGSDIDIDAFLVSP